MKYLISELLNLGFLFSFFHFKISELCNSEVLFSLNAPPTLCRPSDSFAWIKLDSKNKTIHLRDFKDAFLKYGF